MAKAPVMGRAVEKVPLMMRAVIQPLLVPVTLVMLLCEMLSLLHQPQLVHMRTGYHALA
jgi:hypothetical protein